MAILLTLILGVVLIAIAFKLWLTLTVGQCKSRGNLNGKTAIVTGANTGIGFWTAFDLANRNGRVILACRDMKKGEEALQKIIVMTGNQNVRLKHLDLSSLKSVRKFTEEINREERHLHILVNNAGATGLPKLMTEDGLERTFAINYFGPFLLTNLLLGVIVNCLHPGNIKTELCRSMSIFNKIFLLVAGTIFFYIKTPVEGAQTSIYCAVSDEVEGVSGQYFVDCGIASPAKQALDDVVARKLWNISCEMTAFEG